MMPRLWHVLTLVALAASAPGRAATEGDAKPPQGAGTCRAACVRECLQNCNPPKSNWTLWSTVCSSESQCPNVCQLVCRSSAPLFQYADPPDVSTSAVRLLVNRQLRAQLPLRRSPRLYYAVMARHNKTRPCDRHKEDSDVDDSAPSSPLESSVVLVDPGGLEDDLAGEALVPAELSINLDGTRSVKLKSNSGWSVRVSSMARQGALVFVDLWWRPPMYALWNARIGGVSPLYLVTWEVDGGGITGNLYTDSASVTLSLWADAVFHVQVELSRRAVTISRSSRLRLDTGGRMAARPEGADEDEPFSKPSSWGDYFQQYDTVISFGIMMPVYMVIMFFLCYGLWRVYEQWLIERRRQWRCRCRVTMNSCSKCAPKKTTTVRGQARAPAPAKPAAQSASS